MRTLLVRASAFLFALSLCSQGVTPASAQSSEAGVVTGRVFNERTGEYVRNAEISIAGSPVTATSGNGGYYRIANVPAGPVELVVNFAGYPASRASVSVEGGRTSTLDIVIGASGPGRPGAEDTIVLSEFEISSELEGNAKQIMNQRASMDLGRSIASDVFGDVTEGNVGEFLKYLPGIEMEYVEADTRGPRLGGLNPEYTGVSVDGMKSASADGFMQYGGTENGGTGLGGRSFSFEQVSINSIESIEISRVTPPNLDADAPAGTINLKTKRAFDRKKRQIKWSLSGGFNSEEFTLNRTTGPGDSGRTHKVKPSLAFNFADSFFDNRFGVLLGVSVSNLYNEQYRAQHLYNRTPTATDTRPQVLTQLTIKDGPKWTNRTTYTGTFDYKASDSLRFGLNLIFNQYEANFWNRNVIFQAAANGTGATNGRQFVGGDGVTTFNTTTAAPGNRFVNTTGGSVTKITDGYNISPNFEWRRGNLLVEGRLATSRSENSYGSLRERRAGFGQVNNLNNIQFTASRPGPTSGEWTVVQTGGADWANLANFTNPRITDDVRIVNDEVNAATLDFTYNLDTRNPVVLRAGAKFREQRTNTDRKSGISNWSYIGPGGGTTGSWAAYPSDFIHDPATLGVRYQSISGGGAPPYADTTALGRLFHSNPEFFVQNISATNYFNAAFGDVRRFKEDVPAVYVMANGKFGPVTVQGGLRWEDTETRSREFDPRTASEVVAAGFAVDGNGRATTIPGLDYQYLSKPKIDRKGDYDRLFPSLSMKYKLGENLIFDLGAGHTIRRPEVTRLVGVARFDEINELIRTSNSGLLPEFADRVAGSAAYYFGGTNNLSLTLAHTEIENLFVETDFDIGDPAVAGLGFDPVEFAGYTVRTIGNSPDSTQFRSLELAYRHYLDFLPDPIRGTSVFLNYTRTYTDKRVQGVTPHVVSAGFDWRYRKFGFGLKGIWVDDAPWTGVTGRFRESNVKLDGSVDYRFSSRLTAFVQARNITNEDHHIYEAIGGNIPVTWRRENYGSNWVFGLRGEF